MTTVGLGPIERRIGVGEERGGIARILRIGRHADAQTDGNLLATHLEVLRQRIEKAIGQHLRGGRLLASCLDEREFIAADARDEGALRRGLQALGDGAQEFVADRVPEDVVGLLEMIEVDSQDGEAGPIRLGAIEGLREADGENGAVRQARQHIVMCKMRDLLVSRQQLRARRVHLLARLVETERRFPHLLLQDVEARTHLAEFVAG